MSKSRAYANTGDFHHWCIHTHSPFFMIDGLTAHNSEYGLWRMNYDHSAIRGVKFDGIEINPDFAPYKGTRPAESQFPKYFSGRVVIRLKRRLYVYAH